MERSHVLRENVVRSKSVDKSIRIFLPDVNLPSKSRPVSQLSHIRKERKAPVKLGQVFLCSSGKRKKPSFKLTTNNSISALSRRVVSQPIPENPVHKYKRIFKIVPISIRALH